MRGMIVKMTSQLQVQLLITLSESTSKCTICILIIHLPNIEVISQAVVLLCLSDASLDNEPNIWPNTFQMEI